MTNKPLYLTPGDWRYADELSAVVIMRKHRVVPIADFGKISHMESHSNGKVIAASKKMYEALRYYKHECSNNEPSISAFNRKVDEILNTLEGTL